MRTAVMARFKFVLERWIQAGVLHQLLLMVALIAVVAVIGGLCAWAGSAQFETPRAAVWWAFLRLTDPGYLGDDEGTLLRVVSTIVTVLGYVIFMGSLIAIMTQWLAGTLRRLESGLTPISMKDHVIVLGWTNRTAEIVQKLLGAQGRLRRFLAGHDADTLRIVILADDVSAERRLELRDHLGPNWLPKQIFLRTGSSLQPEHLARLDLRRAAAVVVPGADFELGGAELTDTRIVKTLLTVGILLADVPADERPHVVAELFDPATATIARNAVTFPLEVISSDRVISRLISQSVMHRGVARILIGLLSHREGNSFFVRRFPELAGSDPRVTPELFPRAVFLGVVRHTGLRRRTLLDPIRPLQLERDDLMVFLAECYDDCAPARALRVEAAPRAERRSAPAGAGARHHRLLVLGWSHKVPALLEELDESRSGSFDITILSRVPVEERASAMEPDGASTERLTVRHLEGDYCVDSVLLEAAPASFDNVLFVASAGMGSSEEADARTVLGYVLLRALLRDTPDPPELIVELLDPDSSHLFADTDDSVLVSPRLLSHLLAHVALRPELNAVFDELFGAEGPEFTLVPARELGLPGRDVRFPDVQRRVLATGRIAVGIALRSGGVHLNPPRDRAWDLEEGDHVVVLAPHDAGPDDGGGRAP